VSITGAYPAAVTIPSLTIEFEATVESRMGAPRFTFPLAI
jgi:hypothetical protein